MKVNTNSSSVIEDAQAEALEALEILVLVYAMEDAARATELEGKIKPLLSSPQPDLCTSDETAKETAESYTRQAQPEARLPVVGREEIARLASPLTFRRAERDRQRWIAEGDDQGTVFYLMLTCHGNAISRAYRKADAILALLSSNGKGETRQHLFGDGSPEYAAKVKAQGALNDVLLAIERGELDRDAAMRDIQRTSPDHAHTAGVKVGEEAWSAAQAKEGDELRLWAVMLRPDDFISTIGIGGELISLPNEALETACAFAALSSQTQVAVMTAGKYVLREDGDGKLQIEGATFNVRIATFSRGVPASEREAILAALNATAPTGEVERLREAFGLLIWKVENVARADRANGDGALAASLDEAAKDARSALNEGNADDV